jgi:hypothetical protein
MGYENSAFPHTSGTSYNHYGPRGTEKGVASGGELHGSGAVREAVIYISGDDFGGTTSFDSRLVIPAGAIVQEVFYEVTEAFTLGNADNIFSIGTNGSEATNGVTITQPDVAGSGQELVGDLNGTWAAALAADTAVGVAVSGTAAGVTAGSGKAKVVIRYSKF